jgi:protoporphyrinogen oxidase
MNIAVVGGGIAGLSAAYDLLAAGHQVTVYEAGSVTGGLAAGFKDEAWEWPLEHYYHHLFTSDSDIIGLVEELGFSDRLFFPRPVTSVIYQDKIVPFDSPKAWITFPGFNLLDVARFGLVSAYLRFSNPWRSLERETADAWLRRWYGDKIYETPRLGYFRGGFQAFVDRLTEAVRERGGKLRLNNPVQLISPEEDGRLSLTSGDQATIFDQCLVTTSPGLLRKMAPDLPADYAGQLAKLKSMGAVVLVLALKQQLMEKTYWLNLPADSADKSQTDIPFLALVEHTNYVDRKHYGGDHIVYCGDYVTPDHAYLDMSQQELEALFTGVLTRFNPEFRPEWIRRSWLFRTRYAQPVPAVNHSQHIPEQRTPIANLFFASMSQVYPWDRGTNYAVQIGRRTARMMLESAA